MGVGWQICTAILQLCSLTGVTAAAHAEIITTSTKP